MGIFRDLTCAAVGYGARTLYDKVKDSKDKTERDEDACIDNLMQNNNIRQILDIYRDSNSIRLNSDKFTKFVNELESVIEGYKREML